MLSIKVEGDYACFTRPEMKVERVSYPVMTPSAAVGILESIFWKPEFSWQVKQIVVLKPIQYFSLVRNEVSARQSSRAAQSGTRYFAEEDRAQRHTLGLRDVAYVIRAEMFLKSHATDPIAKYQEQFRRRVRRGRCFQQPYLGSREFVAKFSEPTGDEVAQDINEDLGLMLYRLRYEDDPGGAVQYRAHDGHDIDWRSARVLPEFFQASLSHGILHIPPPEEVSL